MSAKPEGLAKTTKFLNCKVIQVESKPESFDPEEESLDWDLWFESPAPEAYGRVLAKARYVGEARPD